MAAMAFLAGGYVYADAALPVADAFGVSAGAGLAGAVFGWSLIRASGSARGGTAQRMPLPSLLRIMPQRCRRPEPAAPAPSH